MKKTEFVKSINFTKDNLVMICFSEQQLYDMIRFGSCEKFYSVINFDTTFDLGNFYVSYFTYRNLSLFKNCSEQHPIFMGPLMIHLKKDFETYYYFSEQIRYHSVILYKDKDFSILNVKLIITDDDEGLNGALRKTFANTDFALCCNHIRKKIIRILSEFEIDDTDQEKILFLIFGSQNERNRSLIGSKSKKEYIERLDLFSNYFDSLGGNENAKSFLDWFLEHKAKNI
ncbi:unnamed protein product [Brachionus calyciflorus]|uniref:MULE transposase domain-containing protein n=1 Tax=Brachionus calyciflorus TaxID=104777 RepID=A0A814P2X0_9BILA|nr:unnamed protein product [Brachionus calyciflorus]